MLLLQSCYYVTVVLMKKEQSRVWLVYFIRTRTLLFNSINFLKQKIRNRIPSVQAVEMKLGPVESLLAISFKETWAYFFTGS